ncbi:unnamed protein product [Rhodiola kirilowii]
MNTRFKGQKHVATGSTSNSSLPTVKKPRGRPRKNPLPLVPPIAPIIPPAFQGPIPRPPPLLNPVPYLPPGFRMEDEVENRPILQRNARNHRIDGDEIEDPPARNDNDDDRRPIRNPPAPQRENRNYRYSDEEEDERPVGDYMTPTLEGNGSAIMPPDEDAFDFDVKSSLVHMVTHDQYQGVGNPSTHLANFQEYCRTYKPRNVPVEYVYLKLFPSLLYGDAKEWLQNHEPRTFRTWDHLANSFLNKFFPPSRTKKFTDFILTFSQRDNELFHQAYDRFKHYLRECPHHNFRKADLMRYFYLGMSKEAKNQMDTASGGAIMELPMTQGFKIVDKIAINSDRYQGVDHKKMAKSRDDSSTYATKEQINELSKRMEAMISMVNSVEATKPRNDKEKTSTQQSCFLCGSTKHSTKNCPDGRYEDDDDGYEEAHYVNQQRNYAQNANPITRNYEPPQRRMANDSNFPPKPQGQNSFQGNYQRQNQQGQSSQAQQKAPYQPRENYQGYQQQGNYQGMSPQQKTQYQNQGQQYQAQTQSQRPYQQVDPPPQPSNELSGVEAMFAKLLANQNEIRQELNEVKQSHQRLEIHNKMLETQIAQQADSSTRAPGKLPARLDQVNREHCNAVSLRSGKELESEPPKRKKVSFDLRGQASAEIEELDEEVPNPQAQKEGEVEKEKDKPRVYTPPIPFPQRLKKKSNDKQFSKFAEMMRKLYVTMPFTEVITQAPSYARFLKDVITCRRTIEDVDTVSLNGECSAILQPHMPPKLEDPGSFSISCYINDIKIERAMCDLGASISLMPYSLCKKLNMGEPKPTQMILRLADRSSRFPRGIFKDVPVRVGNFYIPGDFVVLEMEEDNEVPILLGRPFLYTALPLFDTTKGSITMRVGDDEVEFNLEKAQKGPNSTMSCNYLDLVDSYELYDVPNLIVNEIDLANELSEHVDCWAILEEESEEGTQTDKGKESCSVELKALPTSLRYEFLGPNPSLPIIVNASLNDDETSKLLDVVREHKDAIGYSIDDLKGISPNLCMHEINLESDSLPSRERARRLNPIVGEVVKKEVLKLLDAGIIFPVADSKWVSPIHVVPKKGE